MSKEVKVKILDMTYDKDNNLFQMEIEELVGDHKQVTLAVSGRDFGITEDIPKELAQQFCDAMKGKEKNLHIQRDNSSIDDRMAKKAPVEAMHKSLEHAAGYPIDEVENHLRSKDNGDEN